jgi:hypothetical protein
MNAAWTNTVRMVAGKASVEDAAILLERIAYVPHGLFQGWWLGTWADCENVALAITDGAYPSPKCAMLAAASALANVGGR